MMNPQIEAQRINAFVDGELDLVNQLEIEERTKLDADLRAQVDALRQLRAAVREGADYHAAPDALRKRVSGMLAPEPATPRRWTHLAAMLESWFGRRPVATSFALMAMLLVTLNVGWIQSAQDDRLMDEVVASHVRSTLGQHLVDVASSEHHVVKPWLSSKLDFSPPVNELQIPGSVFLGGRVDYLDGHPVAALVYRQGEHVVNSFVWPSTSKDTRPDFTSERGFRTAHWTQGGMAHWVVSDVNREEFKAVVGAVQAGGEDH
jgi:anti-sigma factor RsiW